MFFVFVDYLENGIYSQGFGILPKVPAPEQIASYLLISRWFLICGFLSVVFSWVSLPNCGLKLCC